MQAIGEAMQQTNRTDTESLTESHNPTPRPGPLDGVRVLDLSRFIAGPYCAMLLGDMGADVIKIEPPGRGENSRTIGPFVEGESLYTMVFNRNKRSLTLDLRAEAGKALFRDLLRKADTCWWKTISPGRWRRWASTRTRCAASTRA